MGYTVVYRPLSRPTEDELEVSRPGLAMGDIVNSVAANQPIGPPMEAQAPASQEPSILLTGLTAYTRYMIRVSAVNRAGTGPASQEIIAETEEDGEFWHVKQMGQDLSGFRGG